MSRVSRVDCPLRAPSLAQERASCPGSLYASGKLHSGPNSGTRGGRKFMKNQDVFLKLRAESLFPEDYGSEQKLPSKHLLRGVPHGTSCTPTGHEAQSSRLVFAAVTGPASAFMVLVAASGARPRGSQPWQSGLWASLTLLQQVCSNLRFIPRSHGDLSKADVDSLPVPCREAQALREAQIPALNTRSGRRWEGLGLQLSWQVCRHRAPG